MHHAPARMAGRSAGQLSAWAAMLHAPHALMHLAPANECTPLHACTAVRAACVMVAWLSCMAPLHGHARMRLPLHAASPQGMVKTELLAALKQEQSKQVVKKVR